MNAALALTVVPKSVMTHRAHTHASVMMATHWIQMEIVAMVHS